MLTSAVQLKGSLEIVPLIPLNQKKLIRVGSGGETQRPPGIEIMADDANDPLSLNLKKPLGTDGTVIQEAKNPTWLSPHFLGWRSQKRFRM